MKQVLNRLAIVLIAAVVVLGLLTGRGIGQTSGNNNNKKNSSAPPNTVFNGGGGCNCSNSLFD